MSKCLKKDPSVDECVTSGSVKFLDWRIGAPRGGRHCGKGLLGLEARSIFRSSRREYLASHVLREYSARRSGKQTVRLHPTGVTSSRPSLMSIACWVGAWTKLQSSLLALPPLCVYRSKDAYFRIKSPSTCEGFGF